MDCSRRLLVVFQEEFIIDSIGFDLSRQILVVFQYGKDKEAIRKRASTFLDRFWWFPDKNLII